MELLNSVTALPPNRLRAKLPNYAVATGQLFIFLLTPAGVPSIMLLVGSSTAP